MQTNMPTVLSTMQDPESQPIGHSPVVILNPTWQMLSTYLMTMFRDFWRPATL